MYFKKSASLNFMERHDKMNNTVWIFISIIIIIGVVAWGVSVHTIAVRAKRGRPKKVALPALCKKRMGKYYKR